MARERLGAVGKISNLNDKMISKARYKGKDFPQVSKGMGSGAFLTPDGTFVGTNDHAQTVLDTDYKYNKFVTEKGGSYSRATTQWLRDSGAYRLRGIYPDYTKNNNYEILSDANLSVNVILCRVQLALRQNLLVEKHLQ